MEGHSSLPCCWAGSTAACLCTAPMPPPPLLCHAAPLVQEVLRGYAGDRSAKPVFSGDGNLFDGAPQILRRIL